jgi:hypothetical protein
MGILSRVDNRVVGREAVYVLIIGQAQLPSCVEESRNYGRAGLRRKVIRKQTRNNTAQVDVRRTRDTSRVVLHGLDDALPVESE